MCCWAVSLNESCDFLLVLYSSSVERLLSKKGLRRVGEKPHDCYLQEKGEACIPILANIVSGREKMHCCQEWVIAEAVTP